MLPKIATKEEGRLFIIQYIHGNISQSKQKLRKQRRFGATSCIYIFKSTDNQRNLQRLLSTFTSLRLSHLKSSTVSTYSASSSNSSSHTAAAPSPDSTVAQATRCTRSLYTLSMDTTERSIVRLECIDKEKCSG